MHKACRGRIVAFRSAKGRSFAERTTPLRQRDACLAASRGVARQVDAGTWATCGLLDVIRLTAQHNEQLFAFLLGGEHGVFVGRVFADDSEVLVAEPLHTLDL